MTQRFDMQDISLKNAQDSKRLQYSEEQDRLRAEGEQQVHDARNSLASRQWGDQHVHERAHPLAQEGQVQADQPLLDVMGQLESQGVQALAVIRSNGTLMGLLEKAQIVRLLQNEGQAQPA